MAAIGWPADLDGLGDYFFHNESNREAVVRSINEASLEKRTNLKVRLEEYSPHIYGVIVNKPRVLVATGDGKVESMYLFKIGFTHCDTSKEDKGNRMATVKAKVEEKLKDKWPLLNVSASIIFVLQIGTLDTRRFSEIESDVREKCGIPLPKEVGKRLGLPVHTEWVLTTKSAVKALRTIIKKQASHNKDARRKSKESSQVLQAQGVGASAAAESTESDEEALADSMADLNLSTESTESTELTESRTALFQLIDTKSVFDAFKLPIDAQSFKRIKDFLSKSDVVAVSDDGKLKMTGTPK